MKSYVIYPTSEDLSCNSCVEYRMQSLHRNRSASRGVEFLRQVKALRGQSKAEFLISPAALGSGTVGCDLNELCMNYFILFRLVSTGGMLIFRRTFLAYGWLKGSNFQAAPLRPSG